MCQIYHNTYYDNNSVWMYNNIYIYTLLWVDDVLLYIIASVFEPESYHLIQVMPTFMFWSTAPPPRQRRFEIHGPRRSRKWQRGLEATWRRETWREGWVWDARDPRVCIYIYLYVHIHIYMYIYMYMHVHIQIYNDIDSIYDFYLLYAHMVQWEYPQNGSWNLSSKWNLCHNDIRKFIAGLKL